MSRSDPIDQPIFYFSEYDPFTMRDTFEGIQIFGGIGSGKTSGSGAMIAKSLLESGYGGLVLTAKVDETELWKKYAQETNRSHDLIIVGPDAKNTFNFLNYEQTLPHAEAGVIENTVRLFESVALATSSNRGSSGKNEQFWMDEFRKLLRNAISLLLYSGCSLKLKMIHQLVTSAATSPEEAADPNWAKTSVCNRLIKKAYQRAQKLEKAKKLRRNSREYNDIELTFDYWTREYPTKPSKTLGTILSVFTGITDVFLRGFLNQVFGTTTTFTPEDSLRGKIIILDFPEKSYNEVGVMAQVLFKMAWQRAMERRKVSSNSRPVFQWIDEAQFFINKHDVNFQTTARSARVATVLLTQNLPNYYTAFGGETNSKSFVDSLLGNLTTKIFHNNTCATTNQYASDLFAKDWITQTSGSFTIADQDKFNQTQNYNNHLEYTVLPREFTGLAKGGPRNNFIVEGIVHQGGNIFNLTEQNFIKTAFSQG